MRSADDTTTLAGPLLSTGVTERLIANGRRQAEAMATTGDEIDFYPVVQLWTPDAEGVWLLTEIDPVDHDLAFGICNLGIGDPRPDYVRVCDLEFLFGPANWPVMVDRTFVADRPLARTSRTRAGAGASSPDRRKSGCPNRPSPRESSPRPAGAVSLESPAF